MYNTIKQSIRASTSALLTNKVRSFLTMLGIIIGVGAVIVIMAVGAGAQSLILSQVKSLGSNLIGVLPGKSEEKGPPASVMGIAITTLTYDDALAISDKKNVPNITAAAAYVKSIATVSWGSHKYDTNLNGTTASYLDVEGGELEAGRFFSREEEANLSRVAVLGSAVKKELFGESEAVGQRIKIKRHSFEVIGVMAERGNVFFQDYDDQVFLPIKTMQKLVLGVNHIGLIRVKVDKKENVPQAIADTKAILRARHNITDQSGANDDFTVRSMAQVLDILSTITNALRYFLAAMAALSLLVGGIGIMNIMLVGVTERTREIGLRKAVGASNFDIMSQFLLEAVVVTVLGGIIGIIGGIAFSFLISASAHFLGYNDWEFSVSPLSIILAVAVAGAVGLIFGLYPARKASRLEPVEALRYE
jgi:putative ABC transport system permease protein